MKLLLFKNKSENPKAPHMTGYIVNDENVKIYSVDVWNNTSAKGAEYISGTCKPFIEPQKNDSDETK